MRPEIGLKPASAVLTLVKGDQWRRTISLKNGAVAYDATGATLAASVSKTVAGTELFAPAISTVDADAGQFVIDITEAQSAALTAAGPLDPKGAHWLTIRLTDSAAITSTLAQIRIQVVP